jgi:hypothetical protein
MKTLKKTLILLFTAIALFCGSLIKNEEARAEVSNISINEDVSDEEVEMYLNAHGFEVKRIIRVGQGYDRMVLVLGKIEPIIVYVRGGGIIGHEDVKM